MISKEAEAQILRLFHVEKWEKTAIAEALGVHHSVVVRVLEQEGDPKTAAKRPSRVDPFVPFIQETLGRYPKITASRLYRMIQERGYLGGPDHFRCVVRTLRPKAPPPEAFLRLKTLPGEEAQMDWAHFGKIRIGDAERWLMGFLMVLSHSRRLFLRFFPGHHMPYFLRGHVQAFRAFGGVPRTVLYDNLKSAVLHRQGDAIRLNPQLVALASHYRFQARPVGVRRGNEKGRVERAVRYVRTAFFEGLEWDSLDDLNQKAEAFCNGASLERRWPSDQTLTVGQAFELERPSLVGLPATPFPAFDRIEVSVHKTPYVRFDLNDYSVPSDCVGKTLTVVATMETVRVLDGMATVAQHRRSFDRGKTIENPLHVEAIVRMKRRARKGRGLDRLQRAVPLSTEILKRMGDRGLNIGSATFNLMRMLDTYGRSALEEGIREALANEVYHPHGVRHAIERQREERGLLPSLPIALPEDPRVRELIITPHDLSRYDEEAILHEEEDTQTESIEEAGS